MVKRCVEVLTTIGRIDFCWLIVAFLWSALPFYLAAILAVLLAIVTVQPVIVLVFVLLTTKPGDDLFKDADRLIALFGRKRC